MYNQESAAPNEKKKEFKEYNQHKIHTTKRVPHPMVHRAAAVHKIGRIDIL
jgi:hypothetical protein